jgi:hypothetical protein
MSKIIKRQKLNSNAVQIADRIDWWCKNGDGTFNTALYLRVCAVKKARE